MAEWLRRDLPREYAGVFEDDLEVGRIIHPSLKIWYWRTLDCKGVRRFSRMGQSQVPSRQSYETSPHFLVTFDNFSGPVDMFGSGLDYFG